MMLYGKTEEEAHLNEEADSTEDEHNEFSSDDLDDDE